jgi:hypothetical protein
VRLIKDKPQPGWVKATFLPSEDTTKEILELKKQNEQLKFELDKSKTKAPEGTELLSQGDDEIEINYTFTARGDWKIGTTYYKSSIVLKWNEIFSAIGPLMINESPETQLLSKINEIIKDKNYSKDAEKYKKEKRVPTEYGIKDNDFQTLKIQFRALNLITEGIKKRGIHDKAKYWTLTPYGDTVLTRLRAIKK